MMSTNILIKPIRWFANLPLMRKFLLIFLFALMIPVLAVGIYSYHSIAKRTIDNEKYAMSQGFDQAYSFLSYRITRIKYITDIVQQDKGINKILSTPAEDYPITQQISDMNTLITYLNALTDKTEEIKPILFIKNGLLYSDQNDRLFNMSKQTNQPWYINSLQGWGWLTCCSPNQLNQIDIAAISRPIRSLDNYQTTEAILRVDINVSSINDLLRKASTVYGSLTYLENDRGDLIAVSDNVSLNRYRLDKANRTMVESAKTLQHVVQNSTGIISLCKNIPMTDWYLVSVLPEKKLTESLQNTLWQMVGWMFIFILLGMLLAIPILNSISRRVKQLSLGMESVQLGNLGVHLDVSSVDEIGKLTRSFNFMLGKIEGLLSDQYKIMNELKSADLKALQSQINPHFLYNTLELINWIAIRGNADDIQSIVQAMARYYKLSLSRGKDIITIGEELEIVKNYMLIQQRRFKDKLELSIDAESITQYCIPKITLQPIVENAIYHGILEKKSKQGKICITGKLCEDNWIELTIEDDGVGMLEDEWRRFLSYDQKTHLNDSYGLYNIDMRIRLFYGIPQGLRFESSPNQGTRIFMHVPAILPSNAEQEESRYHSV